MPLRLAAMNRKSMITAHAWPRSFVKCLQKTGDQDIAQHRKRPRQQQHHSCNTVLISCMICDVYPARRLYSQLDVLLLSFRHINDLLPGPGILATSEQCIPLLPFPTPIDWSGSRQVWAMHTSV